MLESYSSFLPSGDFDAIVIGSGIGGLSVAAFLAKEGKKRVLVLERHTRVGGFTHTFRRRQYEWDVGVHYVGEVHHEGSRMARLFSHITDGSLDWEPLGDVYDTIVMGDQRFEFLAGREAWLHRMCQYFPDQVPAITKYLSLCEEVMAVSEKFFAEKGLPFGSPASSALREPFLRYAKETVAEVLDQCTKDPLLQGVLVGQWGDYGSPPKRASFVSHAMLVGHYMEGAAYPVGGASRIANAILPIIAENGGEVLLGAHVEKILVENGRAVGIQMRDGRPFRAPIIISDAGLPVTTHHLLPSDAPLKHEFDSILRRVSPSQAHFCLHIGLNQSDQDLGLGRSNLWVFPDPHHQKHIDRFSISPQASPPHAFISFPSAKDPDFQNRFPGRSTIEVVGYATYDEFRKWEGTQWGRRGDDYKLLKKQVTQQYLEILLQQVPHIEAAIDFTELSTPLTTQHFANAPHGEIYGLEATPARFFEAGLKPGTALPGFFLTGQDACISGVSGAILGGALAASVILRKNIIGPLLENK